MTPLIHLFLVVRMRSHVGTRCRALRSQEGEDNAAAGRLCRSKAENEREPLHLIRPSRPLEGGPFLYGSGVYASCDELSVDREAPGMTRRIRARTSRTW